MRSRGASSTLLLTLTSGEVMGYVVLPIVVVALFVALCNRIFSVTSDEPFARATGVATSRYNLVIAVMISLSALVGMLAFLVASAVGRVRGAWDRRVGGRANSPL